MINDLGTCCVYSIKILSCNDECISYAKEQLEKYLLKITGNAVTDNKTGINFYLGTVDKFPDKNLIDRSITDKITVDGFAIYSKNNNIIITALTKRGVVYGVFEYIERYYGVRFLTCSFEYVPKCNKIIIPDKTVLSNPDFLMRGYFIGDENDEKYIRDEADFDFVVKSRALDVFLKIPEKYGGASKVFGRNYLHNFHYYVPFEIYGNEHPEWYRFFYVNKEITPTIDITNGITVDGKLDESMDISVAKVVIQSLISDAENNPDKDIFNFTQEDGDYFYESEKADALSKKYKRSGVLVRFCNVVVNEVNKYLYNKYKRTIKILTFAYSYAKDAPVKYIGDKCVPIDNTVIADKNLIIQLALFQNGIYSYFSHRQEAEVKRIMNEWKVVASDFWFWMYDINFHKYLYYFDSFGVIQDNLKGFKKYGISSLCVNGPPEDGFNWHANLRSYVYRKMMWNVNDNPELRINEYIDLYYGKGAPYVKEMMEIYHKNTLNYINDKDYVVKTWGTGEKSKYNPRKMLLSALDAIEKGEQAIINADYSDDERRIYLQHIYAVKCTPLIMLYDMFFEHCPNGSKDEYLRLREQFFTTAEKGKLRFAGEHWSIDQYKKECFDRDSKLINN